MFTITAGYTQQELAEPAVDSTRLLQPIHFLSYATATEAACITLKALQPQPSLSRAHMQYRYVAGSCSMRSLNFFISTKGIDWPYRRLHR